MTPPATIHPAPSGTFEGRDLGDEYLFYDAERDLVHQLNATAREVYLLCDGSRSTEEVASAFAEMHDVDRPTAENDAREAIERLVELGVLRR